VLGIVAACAIATIGWFAFSNLGAGSRPAVVLTPKVATGAVEEFAGLVVPLQAGGVNASTVAVQAVMLQQSVSAIVQGDAISTTTVPIGRATGTLFLRNTLSQPVLLPGGTIVEAGNGAVFTVDGDVTVSAAVPTDDGITFGRGQATVTATIPGAAGNVPAGSITSIAGYGATLRVEQGAFGGGEDQDVTVVRAEDVNRVLPLALSKLYANGVQALQRAAGGQSGVALAQTAISPTLTSLQHLDGVEYAVFPPVGSVASNRTFTLVVRGTFSGLAEPSAHSIDDQVVVAVKNQLISSGRATPGAQVQVTRWSVADGALMADAVVRPEKTTAQLPDTFLADVQKEIAGKQHDEAQRYLDALVKDGKIAGYSPLPANWDTVPARVVVKPTDH
jgi:hypothetical protein